MTVLKNKNYNNEAGGRLRIDVILGGGLVFL